MMLLVSNSCWILPWFSVRSGLQGAWGGDQQEQTAHCWGGCGIRGYLVVWVQVFLHIWFVLFCAWWWCFISAQAPWDALAKKCWWCSLKSHCKVRRWPKEARVQRAAQVWMDEFQSLVKFASGPLWGPQSWQRQEGAETQPHCIKLLGSCWRSMWSSRCAHAGYMVLRCFATALYVILIFQAQRNCELTFCLVRHDSLFLGTVPSISKHSMISTNSLINWSTRRMNMINMIHTVSCAHLQAQMQSWLK